MSHVDASELKPGLDPDGFRRVAALNLGLDLEQVTTGGGAPRSAERSAVHGAIVSECARLLDALEGPDLTPLLVRLPRVIGEAAGELGWRWNGIYVLGDDGKLHLGPAHGPPVCSPLEPAAGAAGAAPRPLTSGMCFDALVLNQTMAGYDVGTWPGYVSCDAASGLQTRAGIATPLRDAGGQPVAVWDCDSVEEVELADVRFAEVLFSTLAKAGHVDRRALLG